MISSINQTKAEDSILLSKGSVAPFSGFLLPREKVESFRKMAIDLESSQQTVESLNRSVTIYKANQTLSDEQNKLVMDRLTVTSKELASARSLSSWEKAGYFFAGVALSAAAVYGASQLK